VLLTAALHQPQQLLAVQLELARQRLRHAAALQLAAQPPVRALLLALLASPVGSCSRGVLSVHQY
jgi:hypothetical protein